MPSFIWDHRPDAADLASEYATLQEAGESLALAWPDATNLKPPFTAVQSAAELSQAWEDETVAVLSDIPAWLPGDEFHRVVVVEGPGSQAAACALLARGCEAVEIVAAGAMQELAQSWGSGRRLPSVRLTAD